MPWSYSPSWRQADDILLVSSIISQSIPVNDPILSAYFVAFECELDFPSMKQLFWSKNIHFKPFQTISNHFKPFQTISNHFKPFQTISNHFKPFQTISNHFKPFQTISNHFKPFQTISSHFKPFQTISNHFKSQFSAIFSSFFIHFHRFSNTTGGFWAKNIPRAWCYLGWPSPWSGWANLGATWYISCHMYIHIYIYNMYRYICIYLYIYIHIYIYI